MQTLRRGSPALLYSLLAVAVVAAILPFARMLGELYSLWNLKPEYSHGIIIPLLSAFLIWRQRAELRQLPFTGSWLGLPLIAAGLLLRFVGELTTMETIEHYAFLLVIYGLVLALTGPVIFRRLWMPLLMLVFAIPLPSVFNNALSLQLQLISSQLGVWVIRAVGISVLLEGNVIDLGSYQLEVAEACSGLRYLMPLMTLAFILAYLFRGPMWKRVVIFLASVPITVLMNSLRIGFIGITVERWGSAMAQGALHDFEGWVVFMLSTGSLLLVAMGLARHAGSRPALHEIFNFELARPKTAVRDSVAKATGPAQTVPRPFVAAAVLVSASAVTAAVAGPGPLQADSGPARASFDEFPTRFGTWEGQRDALQPVYLDVLRLDDYALINYRDANGRPVNFYAAYYQTQNASRAVHSPHDCIPGGGWEIQKLEQRVFPGSDHSGAFQINRAVVQLGSQREIVYYWFQERGRQLTSDYLVRWYLLWDGLTQHRTDGGLVRFVAPVPPGVDEASVDASMMALANQIVPTLGRYIPN